MENLISYNVQLFLLHPSIVLHLTLLMISVDKVITIKFPFKHKQIMKRRTVISTPVALWLFAMIATLHILVKGDDYTSIPEFGICVVEEDAFLQVMATYAIPVFTESLGTITFNVCLAIKAYQVYNIKMCQN